MDAPNCIGAPVDCTGGPEHEGSDANNKCLENIGTRWETLLGDVWYHSGTIFSLAFGNSMGNIGSTDGQSINQY